MDFNPREEFDHLGTMVCWHSRYNLGDKGHGSYTTNGRYQSLGTWLSYRLYDHDIERIDNEGYLTQQWEDFIWDLEHDDPESINKAFSLLQSKMIMLPLYLYDHSGLAISTSKFPGYFDTGWLGVIYVDKDDIRREWDKQRISSKLYNNVVTWLIGEVEEYNEYLQS